MFWGEFPKPLKCTLISVKNFLFQSSIKKKKIFFVIFWMIIFILIKPPLFHKPIKRTTVLHVVRTLLPRAAHPDYRKTTFIEIIVFFQWSFGKPKPINKIMVTVC